MRSQVNASRRTDSTSLYRIAYDFRLAQVAETVARGDVDRECGRVHPHPAQHPTDISGADMSFDLFVLAERFDAQVQVAWVQRLQRIGLACTFPAGFSLGQIDESAPMPVCTIGPPLVKLARSPEAIGLYVESSEVAREDVERMRKGVDAELDGKLAAATVEFHFASSAGRSDAALLFQCYGAAALADVTNGVLVDPQEAGAVHGPAVYAVADANSAWVLKAETPDPAPRAKSWWQRLIGG